MKKFITVILFCAMSLCLTTGCAGTSTEDDYCMVEGSLLEIGKGELIMEVEDGQQLYFKLAPETIIYAGEDKEISAGQNIKVVFYGKLDEAENVSVIAVAVLEESL